MNSYPAMTVYRASAGSGKTFTLAIRFIELLINNPFAYRETLAVTFTNKATEEMKLRILSQLYGLANNLSDSKDYMRRIMEDLGCSEQEVRKKADIALHLMLHDFSCFNIETIDSFFQRVLRNLAHELGLKANIRVELKNDEVESMAVDRLIAELKQNDKVMKWIISYIEQKMDDDENWNVISNIKEFGKKIFQQEYKDNAEKLNEKFNSDDNFVERYKKSLRSIISEADKEIKDFGEQFFKSIADNGYDVSDLSSGIRGAAGYFDKLRKGEYTDTSKVFNKSAQKACEGADGWVKKGDLGKPISIFASNTLVPLISEAEKVRQKHIRNVSSAKAILYHINELRLLSNIEQEVQEINKETNCFLLDGTQNLLNKLMENSDAPFVFEKIGGRIANIMIDEFQDTSTVQWENFKKLLLECMSHENSQNLIVGDVKQSIYRWRNGDWSLLNNIASDKDLAGKDVKLEKLDTNYRSETNVIDFNNLFFTTAATVFNEILREDDNDRGDIIEEIYTPELVNQKYPEGKERHGMVDIRIIAADKDMNVKTKAIEMTKEYILDLIEAGARQQDIAILIRGNDDISLVANTLQNDLPQLSFISDEAYTLDASMAVNIIVDAMKSLLTPDDLLLRAQLAKEYQQCILGKNDDELHIDKESGIDKYLPSEYVNERERLLSLPLSDLVDHLFTLFDLSHLINESAYTDAFIDQLNAFTNNNVPDMGKFLEAWDESIHKKTVKGGDLQGIRLLTIHKSKGLEFDHVIIPFAAWDLCPKDSTLWCKTDEEPFAEMPIIPVESGKIKNSVYSNDYYEEKLQNSIDNLNILYVAFTRAGKNLIIINKNTKGKNSHMGAVIQRSLAKMIDKLPWTEKDDNPLGNTGDMRFTFGSMYIKNKVAKTSENVFMQGNTPVMVDTDIHSQNLEFRQSNRSRKFASGIDDAPENQHYITQGTVMHGVLSQIHDASEVESVLNDFVQEGVISDNDEHLNRNTLSRLIRKRIEENPLHVVNRWFSSDVEVFNECSILCPDPETGLAHELRPDRVVKDGERITVIDFKFGKARPEYHNQVRQYMQLLIDMGYEQVDGYLWYIYNNKVEKISIDE